MTLLPAFRNVVFGLAVAGGASAAVPVQAAPLPRLEADAMGGTHVVLPTDAAGKRLILLIAFTKESEGDVKSWSRKLLDDRIVQDAVVYVVVVADKTVSFERGHVRKLVDGAAIGTKEQVASNVLITFNGAGWRELVPPGDKKTAGIVVCDAGGQIVYAKREPFTGANLADVERAAR